MSERVPPEPSKSPRPTRERALALPRWFASREVNPAVKPGTDRPFGESFPVLVALAFCALGVCLTVLAIGRITAASRPTPAHLQTPVGAPFAIDADGGRS